MIEIDACKTTYSSYLSLKFSHYLVHVQEDKELFRGSFTLSNSVSKTEKCCYTVCCNFSKTLIPKSIIALKNLITYFLFTSKQKFDLFCMQY